MCGHAWKPESSIEFRSYESIRHVLFPVPRVFLYVHVCGCPVCARVWVLTCMVVRVYRDQRSMWVTLLNHSPPPPPHLRQGFPLVHLYNSLCRPGGPQTHRAPPGSASQVLGLEACTTAVPPPYFLRSGLQLNLKLANLARLKLQGPAWQPLS